MSASKFPNGLLSSFGAVSAQGKKYYAEDSPSDQYYGFLVEIEDVVDKQGLKLWSVQFELVPLEWMEAAVLGLKPTLRSQPPISPASLLVFDEATPDKIAKSLGVTAADVNEGQWYIITLGKGEPASRVRTNTPRNILKTKASGRGIEKKRSNFLRQKFRPRGKFTVKALRKRLKSLRPREVGVMDVGQASCNLVYDDAGVTQLYVDVGLPMFVHFPSMPSNALGNVEILNPGPCLGNNPGVNIPVILTHWHWDHYTMCWWSNNAAALRNRDWVVPNQAIGPFTHNVFLNIPLANRHVFPVALHGIVGRFVQVIQCIPGPGIVADFNNSGLAVILTVDDNNNTRVLLPGDAAFQSIPGLAAVNGLRWMPATHHGSDRDLIPPPPALPPIPAPNVVNSGRLAYSYGINGPFPFNHCYGHPRVAAVTAYPVAGWGQQGNVESTAETGPNSGVACRGNIMMCNQVNPPQCAVQNCPFHVFPKTLL